MRMADGAGQCICRIRAGRAGQFQQTPYHLLHLFFFRVAVTHHGLLHLQRGIFRHRQRGQHCRTDGRAARLPEHQGGLRVDVDEHDFHRHLLRLMQRDHLAQGIEYHLEPLRQLCIRRLDAAAGNVAQLLSHFVEHTKTCHTQTRINAKNAHYSSKTALV